MPLFRPAIYKQLQRELDNTVFTSHLFELDIEPENSLFEISFKNNTNFYLKVFAIDKANNSSKKYVTAEAPGDYESGEQKYEHESLAHVRSRISQWVQRIYEDYSLGEKGYEGLEEFREELIKQFSQSDISSEHFTQNEKSSLEEKLDKMQEMIDKLYEEKQATQQQINQMHNQISKLKEGVTILDKRTWFSAALNRVVDIYKEVKAAKNEVSALMSDFNNLLPAPEEENEKENE